MGGIPIQTPQLPGYRIGGALYGWRCRTGPTTQPRSLVTYLLIRSSIFGNLQYDKYGYTGPHFVHHKMSGMGSGDELRELMRRSVERMRRRRQVVERVSRLGERSHEDAARRLIVLATQESCRLRRGLPDRYGFAEARMTYRFGPPPASDADSDDSSMPVLKNGSLS